MPKATLTRQSLRSRFGRRLLLLFIVCALLPMVALAVLSFGTVTRQLREGSLGRLEHTGRALAAVITERLRFVAGDLAQVSRTTPCRLSSIDRDGPACDGSLLYGLVALSFVPDSGGLLEFFGRMERAPELDSFEDQQLQGRESVVLVRTVQGQPTVYLARRLEAGARSGVLIGEVYSEYLWGTPEQNPLIPTMQLHVLDNSNQVMFQSAPGEAQLPAPVRKRLRRAESGTFEWTLGDVPYLAAFAPVGPPSGIVNPGWSLVVSEDRDAVEAPMVQFRRTFPFVALLSLAVALMLSLSQLRRHLAPLRALQEGTRRLADQQFDQPVTVSSRDEFADLADSFNTMAAKIARHFDTLVTTAQIDQAVLSSVDTIRIVGTVLSRMPSVCSCDMVGVTLVDTGGDHWATTYTPDPGPPARTKEHPVQLTTAEAEQLRSESEGFTLRDEVVPEYLAPLANLGVRSFTVLPLVYQGELLGAITLAGEKGVGQGDEELMQAKRVAGQIALALTNARMVEQIRLLAFHDTLTGLPNRVSFRRRLDEELERSRGKMAASRSAFSTSIISTGSTTPWATTSATGWCRKWRIGSRPAAGTPCPEPKSRASAATSSP